ncbi:hypothetical protein H257_03250 [Aphanomyces astaci]|uniref:Uncharacterized protein n=1 Tax=Aphanomyces astaci TaxID=112090 RepID=W4H307_APHAT|nr:hypothetical protein H257_03250 [Aphanomyces astaci]ETV85538.1 hypothetical protein H257_03250 [Aphanomyces astaci]|eukprot:XP_009825556.1 hypothetical protein H257_03250 [Aphanomyces astaci]
MSFIDVAEAPLRPHRPAFERLKSIKDVRQAMTRQQSIVDQVLLTTLSKESVGHGGHGGHGGDMLRQTVRNTMVFQLKKSMGSTRSIGSTVSSAAKAVKKMSIDEEPLSIVATVPKLMEHEHHVEEIRQAVIRLVADGEIHTEHTEGERVAYNRQGDLKYYTDENLESRLGLRVHPLLGRLTWMFWLMVGSQHAMGMEYEGYQGIMVRIHKVLIELFDIEDSKVLIREDWVRDTNATHELTYELFHLSLFELIDIWCDSLRPDDYCNLLYLLMHGIAQIQSSGSFRLRRLQDINYTDVVEELHLRPRTPLQIETELDALEAQLTAKHATAAAPPPDQTSAATPDAAENAPTVEATTPSTPPEDITLNVPSGLMIQLDHVEIRPTKLHKVKMVSHDSSTAYKPDAMPLRVLTEPPPSRPDAIVVPSVPLVQQPKQPQTNADSKSPLASTPTTATPPPPSIVPEPVGTSPMVEPSLQSNRNYSQALQPTDMASVLANATSAFRTDATRTMEFTSAPHIRHSSLARPTNTRRSAPYNPNLKDPTSPRKATNQKKFTDAPTTSSGFFIKSIAGLTPIPAGPPSIIAPPAQLETPPPTQSVNADTGSPRPVFNLAGAKSPRGHPVWKPKRPGNNDRFGLGINPPGGEGGDAAFPVKGLGGYAEGGGTLPGTGRLITYVASSGPSLDIETLTGNGIGILGGKPTYKPPKDSGSSRPTGVVMAPKREQHAAPVYTTSYSLNKPDTPTSGGVKLDDVRPPMSSISSSPSQSPYDYRVGGTKRGRQRTKKADAMASEMVHDLASLSFGTTPKPLAMVSSAAPPVAGSPLSPPTRDTNNLRLGSPSAYSKIYRGGQRLLSHLTSGQTMEQGVMFDSPLVARTVSSSPNPNSQSKYPSSGAFRGIAVQPGYDRNLANLQFKVQALNVPSNTKPPTTITASNARSVEIKPSTAATAQPTGIGHGLTLLTATAITKPR